MTATAKQIAALAAPTPKEEIGTRPAKGKSGGLSYIDARFVFDRFDEAVGPENWQCIILWSGNIELEPRLTKAGKEIEGTEAHGQYPMAQISVLTEGGWVTKQDIGDFSDIASVKGGVSDSIKRAAVQWGVARDLYPKPQGQDRNEESKPAAKTPTSGAKRSTRSTKKAVPQEAEQGLDAEQDVVGQTGLTSKQKAKMFAALREAGVPDDQRKDLVHTMTGKWSTKDMTNNDLDIVLDFVEGGEYKPPEDE
jgi:hypothetical protein